MNSFGKNNEKYLIKTDREKEEQAIMMGFKALYVTVHHFATNPANVSKDLAIQALNHKHVLKARKIVNKSLDQ